MVEVLQIRDVKGVVDVQTIPRPLMPRAQVKGTRITYPSRFLAKINLAPMAGPDST